jgi:hypothetical protein
MILKAFAADALSGTGLIGAVAGAEILFLLAFHACASCPGAPPGYEQ